MRLSLLVRGPVPGGDAAPRPAAARRDRPAPEAVARTTAGSSATAATLVLQYWYFYAFNDWRSTFYGVNDHEADWEQVTVSSSTGRPGGLRPAWVAFSSHDMLGPDLRRRWDDPQLRRDGEHPVVYAGPGRTRAPSCRATTS